MFGAIIGDIVGSQYEWSKPRNKRFELFGPTARFTDDTVCTVAVASALAKLYPFDFSLEGQKKIAYEVGKSLVHYARLFPNRQYGGLFLEWVNSTTHKSYNSFGNGSAMRVSSVGWLANSEEEVKLLSRLTCLPTHNHPEGIKGAEAIAMCIYLARIGKSKADICNYVATNYYPRLKEINYLDLVKKYKFDVTCEGSVPEAIYCFIISKGYEDCLRTAVRIGGDSDTIGAMACSIAEAYYYFENPFKDKIDETLNYILSIANDLKIKKFYEGLKGRQL